MRLFLFAIFYFFASPTLASFIQNEDVKSESELISAGGTKAQLINDTKIYVTSVAKTLEEAIADGDIAGGIEVSTQILTASPMSELQTYFDQLTETASGKYILETGNKNILSNPSFEHTVFDDGWTFTGTGALSSEISVVQHGKKSSELAMTAQTGLLCQQSTINASQFDGQQLIASIHVKSSAANGKVCPYNNGVEITPLCVNISSLNEWQEYVIPFVGGSTSNGLCVEFTSTTGTVYIDDAHVGIMPATMTPLVDNISEWELIDSANLGAVTGLVPTTRVERIRRVGDSYEWVGRMVTTTAGATLGEIRVGLPFGLSEALALNDNMVCGAAEIQDNADERYWATAFFSTATPNLIRLYTESGFANSATPIPTGITYDTADTFRWRCTFKSSQLNAKTKVFSNKSMGWYVDVNIGGANPSLGTSNVSTYTEITNGSLDMVINSGSQPAQIPCSATNPSSGLVCSSGNESLGVVFDIPSVGTYEVCGTFGALSDVAAGGFVVSAFQWIETPNNAQTIIREGGGKTLQRIGLSTATSPMGAVSPHKVCGVFKFNSVGQKTIRLMYEQLVSGTVNNSLVLIDRSATQGQRDIHITVKPMINNEQITASFKQIDDAIQQIPNHNYVINGNFDFWQRGTSLGADAILRYLADRFATSGTGSTVAPSRQSFALGQSDIPNNPKFFHRTIVVSSAGASNRAFLRYALEDVTLLAGKTVTLSFWIKADSNKQASIEMFQSFGSGGAPSPTVNSIGVSKFDITSSWQKITRTINIPSVVGKTLGATPNDHLGIIFWFDAGSSFNSRTDSLGQQSGTFDIAQVKLEEGSVATPFVLAGGNIAGELVACQRYYEKSYDVGIDPGSATSFGAYFTRMTSSNPIESIRYATTKRSTALITFFNPTTGASGQWRNASVGTALTTVLASGLTSHSGFTADVTGGTDGQLLVGQWTADAEL
jgi:hypothetical protein